MLSILKISQENSDCEILVNIETSKIKYFTNIFEEINKLDESNIEKMIYKKYLNLYCNEDLFDQGHNLILQIVSTMTDLKNLKMYDIFIEKKEDFWNSILDYLTKYDISNKIIYNIFKNLYLNNSFQNIIDYSYINEILLKKLVYCEIDMNDSLKNLGDSSHWGGKDFFKKENMFNNSITYNILLSLLMNKTSRKNTIESIQIMVNECKSYKTFTPLVDINENEYNIDKNINIYLVYLSYIFLKLWTNGITIDKLKKIKYQYLESDQCKLDWLENKDMNSIKYNFLTEMFYTNHKILEYSYITLLDEIQFRTSERNELDRLIQMITDKLNNPTTNYFQELILNESKLKLSSSRLICLERIKFLTNIANDIYYNNYIDTFYKKSSIWLLNISDVKMNCMNDILQNIIIFNLDVKKKLTYDIFNLVIMLLGNNNISNNPHLKTNIIKLLCTQTDNFYSNFMELIYEESKKIKLINNLIHCMIFLNDSFSSGDIYDKYNPQLNISILLRIIMYKDIKELDTGWKYLITIDDKLLKKFINIIINNLSYCIQELFLNLKKIYGLENSEESYDDTEMKKIEDIVKVYIIFTDDFIKINTIFSKVYLKEYISLENRGTICGSINHILTSMLGYRKKELNIKNKDKLFFKPKDLLNKICNLLLNFVENDIFLETLIKESSTDISKLISKMNKILYTDGSSLFITKNEYDIIQKFSNDIKQKYDQKSKIDEIEIPEEFSDPIMMSLIEDPVFLPNTDIIMDREVISRHLVTEEHNPFNREHLTLDMLDEYNKKPDILVKIGEFIRKIEDWKKSLRC